MSYLIPVFLVLIAVAGFVLFLVLNATRRGGPTDPTASDHDDAAPGIGADDRTPLGDTDQHAGHQEGGETVGGLENHRFERGAEADRDERRIVPESERLADRQF